MSTRESDLLRRLRAREAGDTATAPARDTTAAPERDGLPPLASRLQELKPGLLDRAEVGIGNIGSALLRRREPPPRPANLPSILDVGSGVTALGEQEMRRGVAYPHIESQPPAVELPPDIEAEPQPEPAVPTGQERRRRTVDVRAKVGTRSDYVAQQMAKLAANPQMQEIMGAEQAARMAEVAPQIGDPNVSIKDAATEIWSRPVTGALERSAFGLAATTARGVARVVENKQSDTHYPGIFDEISPATRSAESQPWRAQVAGKLRAGARELEALTADAHDIRVQKTAESLGVSPEWAKHITDFGDMLASGLVTSTAILAVPPLATPAMFAMGLGEIDQEAEAKGLTPDQRNFLTEAAVAYGYAQIERLGELPATPAFRKLVGRWARLLPQGLEADILRGTPIPRILAKFGLTEAVEEVLQEASVMGLTAAEGEGRQYTVDEVAKRIALSAAGGIVGSLPLGAITGVAARARRRQIMAEIDAAPGINKDAPYWAKLGAVLPPEARGATSAPEVDTEEADAAAVARPETPEPSRTGEGPAAATGAPDAPLASRIANKAEEEAPRAVDAPDPLAVFRRRLEDMSPEVARDMEAGLDEAMRDPMSGLPAPAAFERARARWDADPSRYVVAFDLTKFKGINENLGNPAGDARVAEVGQLLQQKAAEHGLEVRDAMRAGGDEFATGGTDLAALEAFAQDVLEALPIVQAGPYASHIRYGIGPTWDIARQQWEGKKALETGPKPRDMKAKPVEASGAEDVAQLPSQPDEASVGQVPGTENATVAAPESTEAPVAEGVPVDTERDTEAVTEKKPPTPQVEPEYSYGLPSFVGAPHVGTQEAEAPPAPSEEAAEPKAPAAPSEAAPELDGPAPDTPLEGHGERKSRTQIKKGLFIPGQGATVPTVTYEEEYADGTEVTRAEDGSVIQSYTPEPKAPAAPAAAPAPTDDNPKLPRDLASAKPRYAIQDRQFTLSFESDMDRALYIVGQEITSKRDADYMNWLRPFLPGATEADIRDVGGGVRMIIKGLAKTATGDEIVVPTINRPGTEEKAPAEAAPEPKPGAGEFGAKNTLVTRDRAEELKTKLRAKLNQVNVGVDPEMVAIGTELTVFYIEGGVRKFIDVANKLAEDLGVSMSKLRPFLRSWYNGARDMMEDQGQDVSDMDGPEQVRAALASLEADSEIPTEEKAPDEQPAEPAGSNRPSELEGPGGVVLEGTGPGELPEPQEVGGAGGLSGRAGAEGGVDVRVDVPGDTREESGEGDVRDAVGAGVDDSGRVGPESVETPAQNPGKIQGQDYKLTAEEIADLGGPKQRARQNVDAIRVLKRLQEEKRPATREEQAILAKYVGWGGLADLFPDYGRFKDETWRGLHKEVQDLLPREEYELARKSTQYAHYTTPEVIHAIYQAAKRLGVQGNVRALEPGAGIGHFIGLSEVQARWTAVEMDPTSAGIAQALYPSADVIQDQYEKVMLPDGSFDLVVGNPPFGDIKIHDRRHRGRPYIHDYFFLKSLDKLRPGGILAFVTSTGTMDKGSRAVRTALDEKASFLGAVRLPGGAFQKTAGTFVTTDILFFQKRVPGVEAMHAGEWMGVVDIEAEGGQKYQVNEYFAAHPEMVLGPWVKDRLRGTRAGVGMPAGGLEEVTTRLTKAIEALPRDVFVQAGPASETETKSERPIEGLPEGTREGQWLMHKGSLQEVHQGGLRKLDIPLHTPLGKRLKALVEVTQAARDVLDGTRNNVDDKELARLQKALAKAYDGFVKKYGPLRKIERTKKGNPTLPNLRGYTDPVNGPLAWALEEYDEETGVATKTSLHTKRMFNTNREIDQIDTGWKAMVASLAQRGRVDLPYMSELYGKSEAEIVQELEGRIFLDPVTLTYQTDQEYLSGNVKEKLGLAKDMAVQDGRFGANVAALEKVQPEDVTLSQMRDQMATNVGATWISADTYSAFVKDVLGVQGSKINYRQIDGKWSMRGGNVANRAARTEWSTVSVPAEELFRDMLNRRQTIVYHERTSRDEPKVKDVEASEAAEAKKVAIQARFQQWLLNENERRTQEIHRRYNDLMNHTVLARWDGSHLEGRMPGLAADFRGRPLTVMSHQLDGAWGFLAGGNRLLAQEVGAGKTMTMVISGMEAKRMGLARKPTYAVPNNMLHQFAGELLELYPAAKILVADEDQFHTSRRRQFLARVAADDWDAVILTHSSLGMIETTPELKRKIISDMVAEFEQAIAEARAAAEEEYTVKQLENLKEKMEQRLEALTDKRQDNVVYWEDLGIDMLVVDEAHEYKNLPLPATGPVGTSHDTKKTVDLYIKTRHLERVNPGRGLLFATATPISNTIAEQYVMLRYLAEPKLRSMGYGTLNAWANNFVASWSDVEFTAIGTLEDKYRPRAYSNAFAMAQLFRSVADVKLAADLNLDTPPLKDGAPELVVVPGSARLKRFMKQLQYRWDNRPKGKPQKGADGVFPIINDGKYGSLDARMVVGPHARAAGHDSSRPWDHTKAEYAAARAATIWRETKDIKGTQLIFSDLGVPHDMRAAEREAVIANLMSEDDDLTREEAERVVDEEMGEDTYDVYNDIKDRLVAAGVPANEIAFIQSGKNKAQRNEIIKKVRKGEIRILLGSTAMMGQGTNVQDRLVALHHIDVPYKPSWLQQREGRIVRQGNKLWRPADGGPSLIPYVRIFRYALKGSYDPRAWQILENKIGFINQAMTARPDAGLIEEVSKETLSMKEAYAIIKSEASDNPFAMDWAHAKADVRRLKNARNEWSDKKFSLRSSIAQQKAMLQAAEREKSDAEWDIKSLDRWPHEPTGEHFHVEIGGQSFSDREEAGKALAMAMWDKAKEAMERRKEVRNVRLGVYAGFPLSFSYSTWGSQPWTLTIEGQGTYSGHPNIRAATLDELEGSLSERIEQKNSGNVPPKFSPEGVATTLENLIARLRGTPERAQADIKNRTEAIAGMNEQLDRPFDRDDELAQAEATFKALDEKMEAYTGETKWNDQMPSPDAPLIDKARWNIENALSEEHLRNIALYWRAAARDDVTRNTEGADDIVNKLIETKLLELQAEDTDEDVEDSWDTKGSWLQDPGEESPPERTRRQVRQDRAGAVARSKALAELPVDPFEENGPAFTTIGDRLSGSLENRVGGEGVNVPQILHALSKVTEAAGKLIPMRTGFIRGRRARGQYNPHTEVIRTRNANNIPTSVHEVAHAFERILWGNPRGGPWRKPLATGPMQRELVKLGKDLYGDTVPVGGYKREGWAEYVRTWVTETNLEGRNVTPASVAPTVHEWFEGEFAEDHPEVWAELQKVRKLVREWRYQGSYERARQSIVETGTFGERVSEFAQDLKRMLSVEKLIEIGAPLNRFAKAAEERTGKKLRPSQDPYFTFSALRTTHASRAAYMVEHGMIDLAGNVVGPGLAQIRKLVSGKRNDFTLYLWARRTIALHSDPGNVRESGLSINDAWSIFNELDSPAFQIAAARVYEWGDGVLNYASQASPTFAQVVDRVREAENRLTNVAGDASGDYVPLQRVFEEMDDAWSTVRKGGQASTASPVKAMRGSTRRVKDIFSSMISNAENVVRQSHKRLVLDQIIKLSQIEGMGDMIEEVPVSKRPVANPTIMALLDQINAKLEFHGAAAVIVGEEVDTDLLGQTITFFGSVDQKGQDKYVVPIYDQGRIRWFYVPGALYDTLIGMDVYRIPEIAGLPLGEWFAGKPAAVMRAGTTGLRASFGLIWNPLRDVQTMWVNTQSDWWSGKMLQEYVGSFAAMGLSRLTGAPATEWIDLWMRLGGEMAQPLGQDLPHTARAARRLFEGRVVRTIDPRNWFDFYRELIQFPEGAPRVTELKAIAEQVGWEPGMPMTLDQSLAMLLGPKEVTTDFTAGGEFGRVWNRYAPFHGAAIQGPRANIRAAKRNPMKFAWHGLYLTMMSLLLWNINKDKDWYISLPYRERFMHWWFEHDWGEPGLMKLPRAFEVGMIFAALPEMMMDAWYRREPEQAMEWLRVFTASSAPNVMPVIPGIVLEQAANRQFYFDRPIVPEGEKRRPAEEQYNEYTTHAAIALGDAFKVSPRRIDHVVRNFFGPVGQDLLGALGLGPSELDREKEMADLPLVGRAFPRGGKTGTQPRQFDEMYELLEEAQKRQASFKNPETDAERDVRLQLTDATTAVSSLLYVRRYTPDNKTREQLTREALTIATSVLAATNKSEVTRSVFATLRKSAEARKEALQKELGLSKKRPTPGRREGREPRSR